MPRNAQAQPVRYLVPFVPLVLIVFSAGCTAPNVGATIEGVPICPDFVVGGGGNKMKGSLKKPVVVTVMDDDEDVISQRTLLGRRTKESPVPPVVVQDTDETFIVAWAQCANARAPHAVTADVRHRTRSAAYDCGKAKEYGRSKIAVRKGDASSRIIKYLPPPEPECWQGAGPAAASTSEATAATGKATATPSATAAPSGDGGGQPSDDAPANGADTTDTTEPSTDSTSAPSASATSSPTAKASSSPTSKATAKPTAKP